METVNLSASRGGSLLRVRVRPGARRSRCVGVYNGGLKIEISAPPEDGRANEACRRFLSELLGISAAGIELSSGATSRSKTFFIDAPPKKLFFIIEKTVALSERSK
jgi:uncharacterized protein